MNRFVDKIVFLDRNSSFASRLSFYVISITAVIFIVSVVTVSYFTSRLIEREAIKTASSQLKATNLEIDNILREVSVAIDNIAEEVENEAQAGNREQIFEITRKVVRQNPHIIGSNIGLVPYYYPDTKYFSPYSFDHGDSISTEQVGNDYYAYQYMDWYQIPRLLKKSYWTDPFYDEGAGNIIMCTYTKPLYDKDSTFIGVLTADLAMDWLSDLVNSIKPYDNSYNIMIGKNATYIVHPDDDKILTETIFSANYNVKDSSFLAFAKNMIAGESGMAKVNRQDTLSYVFYAPVPSSGWSLAMVCPRSDVYKGVYKMGQIFILGAIFSLICLFLLVRSIVKRLTRPLTSFADSAKTIATGDFNTSLPKIETNDEMRVMRDSLEYMQTSLKTYIADLQATTSEKERIESELNIAREIQMSMVPKIFPPYPERKDIDLFAFLHPAKEVGGDLYDFFISEDKLYFAIGDVSGKGVPASLFMAVTRSLFRSVAATMNDPKLIVESMNNAISESNERNMFVTMFVAILDLRNGHMKFCNAGHNPPVIISPYGEVSYMRLHHNPPIGLFSGLDYDTQSIELNEGDSIYLYTDGVTEAESTVKELYGEKRLEECLTGQQHSSSEAIINKVYESVKQHAKGAPQSDDITMVTLKYFGASVENGKTLIIKNQVSELNALTEFIDKIGEEEGFSPALTMSLNLAMEEAVSNVIFYAYPKGESHNIDIFFSKAENEICFEIVDEGVYFDPTAKTDADITLSAEDRQIGGLGIYMVKQIMTSVEYRRDRGRNVLTMKKTL